MERLTYRLGESGPYGLEDKASAKVGLFTDYDGFYAHLVAVHKLGKYEDTKLEPEEVTAMQAELKLWHSDKVNSKIDNVSAQISTACCCNCDHKDEYIEELQAKNAALQVAVGKCTDCEIDCAKDWFKSKATELDDLRAENAALKRQAEKAVEDIRKECGTCGNWISDEVCKVGSKDNCFWRWRGFEAMHTHPSNRHATDAQPHATT